MMVNVTTDGPEEEFNPSTVVLVCLVRAFCLNYSSTEDDDDVVGIMHYYNVDRKGGGTRREKRGERGRTTSALLRCVFSGFKHQSEGGEREQNMACMK